MASYEVRPKATAGIAGRFDLYVGANAVGWVWKRPDNLWDAWVRNPGRVEGEKVSNGARTRGDAIYRVSTELEYDNLMERIVSEDERREEERKSIFGAASGRWFHGTNARLDPGEVLVPHFGAPVHGNENERLWVSDNAWVASTYGSLTYEVTPIDVPKMRAKHGEYHCGGAVVVRLLSNDEIRIAGNDWWAKTSASKQDIGFNMRKFFYWGTTDIGLAQAKRTGEIRDGNDKFVIVSTSFEDVSDSPVAATIALPMTWLWDNIDPNVREMCPDQKEFFRIMGRWSGELNVVAPIPARYLKTMG